MPTGYTAAIADGISFQQYAWSCARAFGALVMMRDDPADAPIPEAFVPSDYHVKALAEARTKLSGLQLLEGDTLQQAHAAAVQADTEYNAEQQRKASELRAKYEAMLDQAKAYVPPTPDHAEYGRFMVKQIEESIDFDCHVYQRSPITADPALWLSEQIQQAAKDIRYHQDHYAEEVSRTVKRNEWLSALRQSLSTAPAELVASERERWAR